MAFAQYFIGFGCGDLSKDSDNGTFCGGDGRLDKTLASFDLFSNTPFALALATNAQPRFQINVAQAAASVPEPGTIVLLGFGLVALTLKAKYRRMNG